MVVNGPTTRPLVILILANSAERARRVSLSSVGFRRSCWAAWEERRRRKEHSAEGWNASDDTADDGDDDEDMAVDW